MRSEGKNGRNDAAVVGAGLAGIGALVAPIGENWWEYKKSHPTLELYAEDGGHASPAGSDFAAKYIWETIREHWNRALSGH